MAVSHDSVARATDRGCLVICDVSGYSEYLHSVELDHARDVLVDLTETIVGQLRPTFRLSKLEGDAAFAYALDTDVEASKVLDAIEATYFAFRTRVRDIDHATSCDCAACRLIPQLDLKVISHHGAFVRSRVAGGEELAGPDVILVHRLLKNSLNLTGYALHTQACVTALGVEPDMLGLADHREHYDDVGEVACYIDDLAERWRYESERRREFVVASEAEFELVQDIRAPVASVWEWVSSPEKRPLWEGRTKRVDENTNGGRRGVGTTNHCVHGRGAVVQRVLDWRPFRYFTMVTDVPIIGPWECTFEFRELDGGGTQVIMRGARVRGWRARAYWTAVRPMFMADHKRDFEQLRSLLEQQGHGVQV